MAEPQIGDIVLLRSFDTLVPAMLLAPQRNGSWLLRVFGRAPNLDYWCTAAQGDGPGQWQPRETLTVTSTASPVESLLWVDIEHAAGDPTGEVRVLIDGKTVAGTSARAFLADRPQRPTVQAGGHQEPAAAGPADDQAARWIARGGCPAEASQRGQHIRCDGRFDHAGTQHSNREHELVWSDVLPGPGAAPVDVWARVTALVRALGDTPRRLNRRHPGDPWVVSILDNGSAVLRVWCHPTGYDLYGVGRQFYLASKVDLDTVVREIRAALGLADR